MPTSNREFYSQRARDFARMHAFYMRRSKTISMMRLLVFLVSFVMVYYFATQGSTPGIVISVFSGILLFLLLIRLHGRIEEKKKLQGALHRVNEMEKEALVGKTSQYSDGGEFDTPSHPFSNDLDLFGNASLYQYLNRTATIRGRIKLAEKLNNPLTDKKRILSMQRAVEAMAEKVEWRQRFQAMGLVFQEGPDDCTRIEQWSQSAPYFSGVIFRLMVVVIPALTAIMIFLLSSGKVNLEVFFTYLVVPLGISGLYTRKVNKRHSEVSKTTEMLRKYAILLQEIAGLDVDSEYIKEQKGRLYRDSLPAGKILGTLGGIMTSLDNRLNAVSWALFNGLVMWDILQMIRMEKWQRRYKDDLSQWFEVVAEFDVINSLANFRHNNAHSVFPEIGEGAFELVAEDAGHPLIDAKFRVNNDILVRPGEFLIITGANMAGKSTYLRTIGVNLVLALCGAPVCASRFRCTPVQLITSIRTRDSLQENESYFYAELKRLKAIIDELRSGKALFILLDEILKGTNSRDKHAGSEALLKQLISLNTCGVVATHDVLLGQLQEVFPHNVRNHCFEVDIEGDKLHFDYTLRTGVSKNLNATILMRTMGITI